MFPKRHALALASALGLFLLAPSTSFAQGTTSVDLQGPGTVYAGEQAVFYSHAYGRSLELTATDANGRTSTFTDHMGFAPGDYEVRISTPGVASGTSHLHVRALPPAVSPSAPLASRLANIELFVWDGDHSTGGHVLEQIGRFVGPSIVGHHYAVTWVLTGRQASRQNVDYAISTLAHRGYVLDMYSAVHGYPILLGDGTKWTNPGSNPDLKAVRLFYTTACYGANGANEFLKAGVHSYVAAPGENFINIFHAMMFLDHLGEGDDIATANAKANATIAGILDAPVIGWIARQTIGRWVLGTTDSAKFDQDLRASEPRVFGDASLTMASDTETPPPPSGPRTRGFAGALGALAAP